MPGSREGNDERDSDGLNLLAPDESLDADELGEGVDELSYSPLDYRSANLSWGLTPREARSSEPLSARLARELAEESDEVIGDGIGDAVDTDGEIIDDQVGSLRAGRLVSAAPHSLDPGADYWADDIGIDGGAASAEEAAVHIVVELEDPRWP